MRGILALPVLAAAISCGGDDPEDGDSGDTRTVEDAFGPIDVPAKPERVVAVRHHDIGNMLALDMTPVGIVPDAEEFPFPGHAEALKDVTNVRASSDWMLDMEKALALDPDLIVEMSGQEADPWNREMCDLAKGHVATACYPYSYTYEEGIKQNLLNLGGVLGLQDRASELISSYDARVAGLKQRAADAGFNDKQVGIIIWQGNGQFWMGVDGPSNMILRAVGISLPPFQADPATGESASWSFEQLEQFNDAHALIVILEGAATKEDLEASPVWQALAPVKAGRTAFVAGNLWGWDYMSALMQMLDDVERLVLPLAV